MASTLRQFGMFASCGRFVGFAYCGFTYFFRKFLRTRT